jgi:hypothetical protein
MDPMTNSQEESLGPQDSAIIPYSYLSLFPMLNPRGCILFLRCLEACRPFLQLPSNMNSVVYETFDEDAAEQQSSYSLIHSGNPKLRLPASAMRLENLLTKNTVLFQLNISYIARKSGSIL